MEDTAIPYELPEVENHSFFFIDQRVKTNIEANCIGMMRGNYIALSTGRATGWQVIRYSLL